MQSSTFAGVHLRTQGRAVLRLMKDVVLSLGPLYTTCNKCLDLSGVKCIEQITNIIHAVGHLDLFCVCVASVAWLNSSSI